MIERLECARDLERVETKADVRVQVALCQAEMDKWRYLVLEVAFALDMPSKAPLNGRQVKMDEMSWYMGSPWSHFEAG